MLCRVCGETATVSFSHLVLGKHESQYFYCDHCGMLQTEEPYWLEEAYSSPLGCVDTGEVQRNIYLSRGISILLFFLFERNGKYVDIGGGHGLFVRLMRDIGFEFEWSDKYRKNLFSRGFEADFASGQSYEAATAFEVIEHLENPLEFISDVLRLANTNTLIFSTEVFEGRPPAPDSWWYYAFEAGQHISFFQKRTLKFIAERLRLNLYSHGSIYVLTRRRLNPSLFGILTSRLVSRLLYWVPEVGLDSKIMSDHRAVLTRKY